MPEQRDILQVFEPGFNKSECLKFIDADLKDKSQEVRILARLLLFKGLNIVGDKSFWESVTREEAEMYADEILNEQVEISMKRKDTGVAAEMEYLEDRAHVDKHIAPDEATFRKRLKVLGLREKDVVTAFKEEEDFRLALKCFFNDFNTVNFERLLEFVMGGKYIGMVFGPKVVEGRVKQYDTPSVHPPMSGWEGRLGRGIKEYDVETITFNKMVVSFDKTSNGIIYVDTAYPMLS